MRCWKNVSKSYSKLFKIYIFDAGTAQRNIPKSLRKNIYSKILIAYGIDLSVYMNVESCRSRRNSLSTGLTIIWSYYSVRTYFEFRTVVDVGQSSALEITQSSHLYEFNYYIFTINQRQLMLDEKRDLYQLDCFAIFQLVKNFCCKNKHRMISFCFEMGGALLYTYSG